MCVWEGFLVGERGGYEEWGKEEWVDEGFESHFG